MVGSVWGKMGALVIGLCLLLGVVACGPTPLCPSCPVVELHLLGPSALILQGQQGSPQGNQTWGWVEVLLTPPPGSIWILLKSRLKKDGSGWLFVSNSNSSRSVKVALLGTEEGDVVKVTQISANIYLSGSDAASLASEKGVKLRLRLSEAVANETSFLLSGTVQRIQQQGNTNTGVCQAQFAFGDARSFSQQPPLAVVQDQCNGASSGCWRACSQ